MNHGKLPKDLTGEQALHLVEWLHDLLHELWDVYADELTDALVRRADSDNTRQYDLPF